MRVHHALAVRRRGQRDVSGAPAADKYHRQRIGRHLPAELGEVPAGQDRGPWGQEFPVGWGAVVERETRCTRNDKAVAEQRGDERTAEQQGGVDAVAKQQSGGQQCKHGTDRIGTLFVDETFIRDPGQWETVKSSFFTLDMAISLIICTQSFVQ